MIQHVPITLPSFSRGYHIITDYIVEAAGEMPDQGMMTVFIRHTSAGITINENADPTVLMDFESFLNHIVPERMLFIKHDMEGDDDMPAHIKSSLVGSSVSIPIVNGRLALGTWQGIYLCEFRDRPHRRSLIITLYS